MDTAQALAGEDIRAGNGVGSNRGVVDVDRDSGVRALFDTAVSNTISNECIIS